MASQSLAQSAAPSALEEAAPLTGDAVSSAPAVSGATDAGEQAALSQSSQSGGLINDQAGSMLKDHTQDLVPGSGGGSTGAPSALDQAAPLNADAVSNGTVTPTSQLQQSAGGAWDAVKDGVSNTAQWMHQNPELTKFAGGIVGGAMDSISKRKQLQMQYDLEQQMWDKRRAAINQGASNVHAPVYQAPKG